MNRYLSCLLTVLTISTLLGCSGKEYPLEVVDKVEVDRYMGTWYEIASFPTKFQEGCHCTTAEYRLPEDKDFVRVVNSCRRDSANGELDVAKGKAFIADDSTNAKLKVQFFWPFRGKYWIIALDEVDYQYALVGHPNREYLWILSRTPQMADSTYNQLLDIAAERDFNTDRLQQTDQSCHL